MTAISHLPLQKAVYNTLHGDATLMALISDVYDHVPQGTDYPYIAFGEPRIDDVSNMSTTLISMDLPLHIWSRDGGRKQVATIMERVHTLLHLATLSLTGQTLLNLRFDSSRVDLQNDGYSYKGTMAFHALLQVG
ncbi:MAG: DUF3168 domain-containing protein [Rickettsiales bacterium]|nr:DUF3168 domain-containing protein [Rickettsiales bacterium]